MTFPDPFVEYVGGEIIGPFASVGRLYYDGRPQGQAFHAEDDAGLKQQAQAQRQAIEREMGRSFLLIYPGNLWELRIFD